MSAPGPDADRGALRRAAAVAEVAEEVESQALTDAEQDAADLEQHLSEADQAGADSERTASGADQAAADADQLLSDRDQHAADRDQVVATWAMNHPQRVLDFEAVRAHEASQRERGAAERERAATTAARAETTATRERTATGRDSVATSRDSTAAARDRSALLRSRAVRARTRLAVARIHLLAAEGPVSAGHAEVAGLLEGIIAAWDDQTTLATIDRRAGANDRSSAAQDRRQAALDRRRSAVDRSRAAAQEHDAGLDELTGAFRRGAGALAVQHELDRAEREDQPVVLLMIDVDDLKAVNDGRGHREGDALLGDLADALRATLRSYDLLVRWGGDEFVLVLSGLSLPASAVRVRLMRAELAARRPQATIAVGHAEHRPGEALTDLVQRADASLYEDKRRRRN